MHTPKLNQLSVPTQLSLIGVIVLLVGVFVSVNAALVQQQNRSNASTLLTPLPTISISPSVPAK